MNRHARRGRVQAKPATRELAISPAQSKMLMELNAAAAQAQGALNLALSAVVAGHGLADVRVLSMDSDKHTLTIAEG